MPVKKDVLRLQVPMADVETVAVRQSGNDLTEDADGFVFGEIAVGRDMVEQLASVNIFENNVPGSTSARMRHDVLRP